MKVLSTLHFSFLNNIIQQLYFLLDMLFNSILFISKLLILALNFNALFLFLQLLFNLLLFKFRSQKIALFKKLFLFDFSFLSLSFFLGIQLIFKFLFLTLNSLFFGLLGLSVNLILGFDLGYELLLLTLYCFFPFSFFSQRFPLSLNCSHFFSSFFFLNHFFKFLFLIINNMVFCWNLIWLDFI